jgi:hypothetical protein
MSDRSVAVNENTKARNENLPFPVVKYPPHYGTFIGFKPGPDGDLYFCSCARESIENYSRCVYEGLTGSHQEPTPENTLNGEFPEETKELVQRAGIDDAREIVNALQFEDELCHECNVVVPNRRYCHEMYGTVFCQNYGWYIYKKAYEYGICKPKSDALLADTLFESLPADIVDVVDEELLSELEAKTNRFKALREKRRDGEREIREGKDEEMRELRDEFEDERRSEAYYRRLEGIREKYEAMDPLPEDEQEMLDRLREELSENSKRVSDTVENEVRQTVGHYEKGDRWTSETILYQLVQSKYGDEYTIKRHHRPDWLDGLELDIFIVEADVGIEYQGVQHYESVEHWGGEEALKKRKQRDEQTKKLCSEHDVDVIEVRYNEELSEEVLREKVDPLLTSGK